MPPGRPILLWLLAAGTLLAQRPAFVYVTSTEVRVIVGQTLSSKAVTRVCAATGGDEAIRQAIKGG